MNREGAGARPGAAGRLGAGAAGWALLGAGAALLVLPGPGIPLVLAGLVLLGRERPWARRAQRRVRREVASAIARVRARLGRRRVGQAQSRGDRSAASRRSSGLPGSGRWS